MIKLNVGFNRKVGEPNYSSRGANVNLELECESSLVRDGDALRERIRALFRLARAAVNEELENGRDRPSEGHEPKSNPPSPDAANPGAVCTNCGAGGQSDRVVEYSLHHYGEVLCYDCQQRLAAAGRGGAA